MNKFHPYHIVEESPWPLFTASSVLTLLLGIITWFYYHYLIIVLIGLILTIFCIISWVKDVIRESTYEGHHSAAVEHGLKLGFILFIVSEICLFFSLFWAFFHSSLSPSVEIGVSWPPAGVDSIHAFSIPLLNTLILLSSGVTLTWAHYALVNNDKSSVLLGLILTIVLGVIFTGLQVFEYFEAPFTIADSCFGSSFFMATGFHGAHVLLGTIFLIVCIFRTNLNEFNDRHHFWFEAASWYWHFVDVVWLFLYTFLYWWGG